MIYSFPDSNRKPEARGQDEPEEDELDALLAEQESIIQPKPLQKPLAEDSEGEDDLEALLAEAERPNISTIPRRGAVREIPEEGDDLNALMAERETESNSAVNRKQPAHDEDDDELDALMAE